MKRKIIKVAEKTLVVSLPTAWVNSQGLNKGDELDVDIKDYKLILTPPLKTMPHLRTTINVEHLDERVLRWEISSLHKQGYDEITVTHYNDKQFVIIEELIEKLFVGFIIKDQSQLRIVIGQVALIDAKEFDATLRRAFRLLNTTMDDLFLAFEKQDKELLAKQLSYEQTNNKLTNFCERLLNKALTQKSHGHFWYVFAWNLEKVADNCKYIAQEYSEDLRISPSALHLLKEISVFVEQFYECIYSFSFEKLVTLSKRKRELAKELLEGLKTGDEKDRILLHYLHMVVLQMADFSASLIALQNDSMQVCEDI